MNDYTNDQKREIEHLAANTKNLKDVKGFGLKADGSVKKGYYRLKDNRVIYLKALYPTQHKSASSNNEEG